MSSASVGCTVNRTPLDAGRTPQPFKCLLGGLGGQFCAPVAVMPISPAHAPWSRTKAGGFAHVALVLQGVIQDQSSTHPSGLSVTNAVSLVVQLKRRWDRSVAFLGANPIRFFTQATAGETVESGDRFGESLGGRR